MSGDNRTVTAAVDKHISRFGERLHSILGKGRIPRRDKEAKAEAAMRAVDDLVGSIEGEVGRLDDPALVQGGTLRDATKVEISNFLDDFLSSSDENPSIQL